MNVQLKISLLIDGRLVLSFEIVGMLCCTHRIVLLLVFNQITDILLPHNIKQL